MELKTFVIPKPDDVNLILGHAHLCVGSTARPPTLLKSSLPRPTSVAESWAQSTGGEQRGIETEQDIASRRQLLRRFASKLD
jgi:adenosine/AMP kinase